MKIRISLILLFIFSFKLIYSQSDAPPEVFFTNLSNNPSRSVQFKIYPISMVFNGDKHYNLKARFPDNQGNIRHHYLSGAYLVNNSKQVFTEVPSGSSTQFGPRHDRVEYKDGSEGCIGFGIYKVEILEGFSSFFDTITVEYDYGYPNSNLSSDLELIFRNDINGVGGSGPRVNYTWGGNCSEQNISTTNRKMEAWNQCSGQTRPKESNFFIYDNSNENSYNLIPLDARRDCNVITGVVEQNQEFYQERSGLLSAYLSIRKDVISPNDFFDPVYQQYFTRNISILAHAQLNIYKGSTLTLNQYDSLTNAITVNVLANGALTLTDSADIGGKIIIKKYSTLNLNLNSKLYIGRYSEIRIKSGGIFCNYGASIRGAGKIFYEGGTVHQTFCAVSDYLLQDSIKFILDSNAIVTIPNNTTLHLRGIESALILHPGSKLLFGENSGIICDSGAKVIANYAEFASIDSTKKWNGISLNDLSHDTIKNCVIKNAMYGIAINDKHTDEEELEEFYSTEISNCSFINQTNYVLNNAVYAEGSSKILIKDNTIQSFALLKGFTHGIYAEYCPAGNFNVIGNTISNTGAGMTLISCSPFVVQNNIEGNEYCESGFFLDNVNGKFEYNLVSEFYYAYYSFTSSPDLLKNSFESEYDDVMYLSYSSVPSMKPVQSGSDIYWYSGDNTIKGNPSDAGILFDEDSYPNMNYGYNRITLTGNTYYITGINPSSGARYFDVYQNYWGETPDSSKFYVYNSDGVRFNPYDNDSQTPRETNNYDLIDIGFGLYDTVYYYESDNPSIAQELFLEGMRNENEGDYTEAINIFKEIIRDHKESELSHSCFSKIYNSHEKKRAAQNEYSSLEDYYEAIYTDTTYNLTQRNISEEFMLKSKIKQNNIEEAISEYNDIYTLNTNTSKGTHALINREILSAASGDNSANLSQIDNIEIKQTRINRILSNIIKRNKIVFESITRIPVGFQLHQNYPNPFNPSTKISFTIPKGSFVTLKVYDITGREVKTLINEYKQSGSYETEFDASLSARQGNAMPSGVYYYKLEAGDNSEINKMILVK